MDQKPRGDEYIKFNKETIFQTNCLKCLKYHSVYIYVLVNIYHSVMLKRSCRPRTGCRRLNTSKYTNNCVTFKGQTVPGKPVLFAL